MSLTKAVLAATAAAAVLAEPNRQIAAIGRPETPPRAADTNYPFAAQLGIRFNGTVRPSDVVEFNADEGWIKVGRFTTINGQRRWRMERGRILTVKLTGTVEPFWK